MTPSIQCSFVSGELSPSFLGRTDKPQYRNGASTMRNCFVRYQGGASSRAGFAYCGMCKQGAPNGGGTSTSNPPRLINFQVSINQGFALEFGDQYMRILSDGAYVIETPKNVTNISQNTPGVITIANHGYVNGDWLFGSGIGGMTEFNGLTWVVQNAATNTFQLTDLFGNAINTNTFPAYTSGGTFARIYTVVSPYAAIDLPYLKFTENANTMNLTCWNQVTNTEYAPYTLQRKGNTNWVFSVVSFASVVSPPATVSSSANNSTTKSTWYSYQVTSVDINGNESIASKATDVQNNDISINAGSNLITWTSAGSSISNYNIYAATPVYAPGADPGFVGVPYGLIGSASGLQFTDTNIIVDFDISPPLHNDPFARGPILNVTETSMGSGYIPSTIGYTITTSTGTGFSGTPIVQNLAGNFTGFIISDNGENYAPSDTITITSSGSGAGATASLSIGAQTGTYPGTVQYYQQRLVYADTINEPDTYFMSQPGLYYNFDSSIPTVDSDAITGTPWAVQINGIQFMVPSIQGLLAFTGNGVWLINGGNSVTITPSDQNAQAQSQVGCSAVVPPLFINLHILYVQAKNSIVRDIAFNFLTNVFAGTDITIYSNHLFLGYTLKEWAYAEEPYKVLWAVRNDGVLLSLTYIKEQDIQGWTRHDTNGLFTSICSVIEPPVNQEASFTIEPPIDAIYVVAQRYIVGHGKWVYYSERANNRIWQNIEDCFCVDSGLFYPLTYPNATLTPSASTGTNNISSTILIEGGQNYTNPTAIAVDSKGVGTGATFSVTQTGGVLNVPVPISQGENYTIGTTKIIINDPTGTGAIVQPIITNNVLFTSSAAVFNQIQYIYVANFSSNSVSVIDPISNLTIENIAVGNGPSEISLTPDGSQAWVINEFDATISIIDTASFDVINTISVGSFPFALAFTPNGNTVYVADEGGGVVYPITVSNQNIGTPISVGSSPDGICVLPNGVTVYVSNSGGATVTPITVSSNTPGSPISVGSVPAGIAATPDSLHVWVTNSVDNSVSVIRVSDNSVIATIGVGGSPNDVAIAPSGEFAYVTNLDDGTVSVISTSTNEVVSTIASVGINPTDIISLDGQFAYVTDQNGSPNGIVYVISTLTNKVIATVGVESSPIGIGISSVSTATPGIIGDVIRVDGGHAVITEYISSTQVMANITQPLTLTIPNDPNNLPIPAIAGTWSMATPITVITGLNHLEGMTVTGLADGGVITPQVVINGQITLDQPASAINVGLGFTAQVQTMYLDSQEQVTVQGRRKNIQAVTSRLEASRGIQVGTNQPDASVQPNQATVPWTNMKEIKERNNLITAGSSIPLFTGDHRILVPGDWATNGQMAFQQIYPLPMNLVACIGESTSGDTPA